MYIHYYNQVDKVLRNDLAFSVPFFVSCLYISMMLLAKEKPLIVIYILIIITKLVSAASSPSI